jgi:hypothetical protein
VVVPIPTFPFASIINAVEVAEADDVATTNRGRFEADEEAVTESLAQGEDVPIPNRPPESADERDGLAPEEEYTPEP